MTNCPILFVDEAMLASVSAVYVLLFYYVVVNSINTIPIEYLGTFEPVNLRTAGQSKWAISQQIDK